MILLARVKLPSFPLCLARSRIRIDIRSSLDGASQYMLNVEPPFAQLSYDDGRVLTLSDAVSQRDQEVAIVTSLATPDALLIGGLSIYRVPAEFAGVHCMRFFRSFSVADYWYSKYYACAYGMMVEYDHGLLLVSDTLEVLWHTRKPLLDRVVQIDGDDIVLRADRGNCYSVNIIAGSPNHRGGGLRWRREEGK